MPANILTQQQQTVLELLRPSVEEFGFYLAGGTALAMQIGHRKSVDFDFFTQKEFNTSILRSRFQNAELMQESRGTLSLFLSHVKISFLEFPYPMLQPSIRQNGISLASIEDIAAMKISAIVGRGSRKDFIDLFSIIQKGLSLNKCIEFFEKKFVNIHFDKYGLMRSLSYFDDAEAEKMPEMIVPIDWMSVKEFYLAEVKQLAS